jgi:hypothetical protein
MQNFNHYLHLIVIFSEIKASSVLEYGTKNFNKINFEIKLKQKIDDQKRCDTEQSILDMSRGPIGSVSHANRSDQY